MPTNESIPLGSPILTIFSRAMFLFVLAVCCYVFSYVRPPLFQVISCFGIWAFSFWISLRYVYGEARADGIYFRRFLLMSRLRWDEIEQIVVNYPPRIVDVIPVKAGLLGQRLYFRTSQDELISRLKAVNSVAATELSRKIGRSQSFGDTDREFRV